MAGPGIGDVSSVQPLTAKEVAAVGSTSTDVRVLSFKEKELITRFKAQDWVSREIQEVCDLLHLLKNSDATEPVGLRAQVLPQDQIWVGRYPAWLTPFRAGQLFAQPAAWESCFAAQGEPVPGVLKKWIRDGYSVWLNVAAFGKQAGHNKLSQAELQFALRQAREWEAMGALQKVDKPAQGVLVCNIVVAYRGGQMDRVCWAGNAINEGVKADPFKMESLQSVVRLMQPGDWMFSFDLKKGYFQIPLKRAFQEFTYMRIGDQ